MNTLVRWALVAVAAVGLGIDAYTHLDLASLYDGNKTSTVSQGTLFRIEAVFAILVGIALIVRANLMTALAVVAVAGGGLFLLLLYRYVSVGKIGPLPDMSEPLWYAEKSWCAWGEGIALGAALLLAGDRFRSARTSRRTRTARASRAAA
ncbi:MAG: hypothetical protein ABI301_02375 [Jatrophihabitantaceae bacterium]